MAQDVQELHASGLSYGRLSKVLGLSKSTLAARGKARRSPRSCSVGASMDEEPLRLWIRLLKQQKPTWGIRRVRAWVVKVLEVPIGRKRTARILRQEQLLCPRIKKRVHRRERPRAEAFRPNQMWAMDMTQFMLTTGRALYLVITMDIFSRQITGWHLSHRCRATEWLNSLEMGLMAEFPDGSRGKELTLRIDNGCQPTSRAFQDALKTLEITPEWSGYNSPKQNAHVERVIGTLKADWLWIEECDAFAEAKALVQRAVKEYNEEHPHSSLAFLSPNEFRRAWNNGQILVNPQHKGEITLKAA